jgi:hypothetical protein
MLTADQPVGTEVDRVCIADRMQGVRLFDVLITGNAGVSMPGTEAKAIQTCKEMVQEGKAGAGSCGFLKTMLKRIDALDSASCCRPEAFAMEGKACIARMTP